MPGNACVSHRKSSRKIMFEHDQDKAETGERLKQLLTGSLIIRSCTISADSTGNRRILITIDEDEAANLCREQIHGLVEQAVQAANSRLPEDKRIDRWTIVEDQIALS